MNNFPYEECCKFFQWPLLKYQIGVRSNKFYGLIKTHFLKNNVQIKQELYMCKNILEQLNFFLALLANIYPHKPVHHLCTRKEKTAAIFAHGN